MITNDADVLGLGDIALLAGGPLMEGRGVFPTTAGNVAR
jgi:malic enzyme